MRELDVQSAVRAVQRSGYALSPMQSGMLFQALLDTGDRPSAGYDIEQLELTFEEELEVSALSEAFALVAHRHPVLSTTFHWEGLDAPCQVLNRGVIVPVEGENLAPLSGAEQARRLEEFLLRDRQRGFDMRIAPLMRVKVFALGGGRTTVVWTFHHILFDGRAFAPLLREIFLAYDALLRGETPPAGPPERAYSDFIAWLSSQDKEHGLRFFSELLEGKAAATPLPCAEPSARARNAVGHGELLLHIDQQTVSAARAMAARTSSTLNTVLQAAWALVLARHTGDDNVVFGSTRACRCSALGGDAKAMVGVFINTLPMHARFSAGQTVAELLGSLRSQSLQMRPHEHTPLVEIQRRAAFGGPLFETLLMFESSGLCQALLESGDPRWARCTVSLHEQPALPLTLIIYDGRKLEVKANFDRRRFLDSSAERLLCAFQVSLQALCVDENRPLAELDVISARERAKILSDWNDTARPFPDQLCIHEPFEAQVARTPNARALELNGVGLSYRELEERANRLGQALRSRGARPGIYVGVCFSRSLELVIALLAVAKSGAAYVPLDPRYPRDRLAFMLSDANAPLVVTESAYRELFDTPLLVLDAEGAAEVAGMPADRPQRISRAEDVCYAIFTSGSTGTPKGVVLSHRAVVNTFDWVSRSFAFGPGDRVLFVTSPCFDLSVFDTFGVLGTGGTVVVASSELLRDPKTLAEAIVEQRITVWDSAPAALQRLLPFFPESSKTAPLRLLMLSGDWIPVTLPDAMRGAFPGVSVQSLGGATEAAIWSNSYAITGVDPRWTSIPYGKPIQNCRYHVLDSRLQPVPIGVAGDLYIGGICLANGYLNRDQLTRERFVADPFHEGERLYKTGDLARYFEDGNLEFVGRADFQVKIRGFRVEMGEIEAALAGLPGVAEAACAAFSDASGQKSLVAYVVARAGYVLAEDALKAAVAAKLPDFMVPAQVMILDSMPLSRNGKLDRQALPNPATRVSNAALLGPRNEREARMTALWEDVLQRRPIGVQEDFFALGGHSLLAVLLVSKVKAEFGTEVPLSRMMDRPTIESLVRSLDTPLDDALGQKHLITLSGQGGLPPLFMFPGSGGYSFIYRELPALLGEDQPVFALRAIGSEGARLAADQSIEEMADTYVPELLEARPSGPYVLAGYSFGILVAFEVATRLRRLGHAVPLLISLDGFAPGFPSLLPLGERLVSHVKAFLDADSQGRAQYLRTRFKNSKRRLFEYLGQADKLIDDIPLADQEMNDRMRKLWASFWQARARYFPKQVESCNLLLIKAEIPEQWIGNKMDDPVYGWDRFISGAISIATIPGKHLELFERRNQEQIARVISQHIAKYAGSRR